MWKFIKELFTPKTEWVFTGVYWIWKCKSGNTDFTIDKTPSGYRLWEVAEGRTTFTIHPTLKQAKNAAKK